MAITLEEAKKNVQDDLQMGVIDEFQKSNFITITLNGKRNIGDTGNDFVAGKQFKNGHDAEGYFEWIFPDGTSVSWANAVFDVKNCGGGDATNVGALEFDVISNGKPTLVPAV